jgi:hypothetical protein
MRNAKKRDEAQKEFYKTVFGDGIQDPNNQETAQKIKSVFQSINIWNLPNLGTDLDGDNNEYQDLTSDNYQEAVQTIKSVLLKQLSTPRAIRGQTLTGTNFAAMIGSVVETLNTGAPISI